MKTWDVFISHASEDKESIVEPLVQILEENNISCWYDKKDIGWGDSIIEKINEGLETSKYVVFIISQTFLSKEWTQIELNSTLNIQISNGEKKVLPVIVGDIKPYHLPPLLRDKKYIEWNYHDEILDELIKILEKDIEKVENTNETSKTTLNKYKFTLQKMVFKPQKENFASILWRIIEEVGNYENIFKDEEYANKIIKIVESYVGNDYKLDSAGYLNNHVRTNFPKNISAISALILCNESIKKLKELNINDIRMSIALNNKAIVLYYLKEFEASFEFIRKSLKIKYKVDNIDSISLAISFNNLGIISNSTNDSNLAMLAFQKSLDIIEESYGDSYIDVSIFCNNFCIFLERIEKFELVEVAKNIYMGDFIKNWPTKVDEDGKTYSSNDLFSKMYLSKQVRFLDYIAFSYFKRKEAEIVTLQMIQEDNKTKSKIVLNKIYDFLKKELYESKKFVTIPLVVKSNPLGGFIVYTHAGKWTKKTVENFKYWIDILKTNEKTYPLLIAYDIEYSNEIGECFEYSTKNYISPMSVPIKNPDYDITSKIYDLIEI